MRLHFDEIYFDNIIHQELKDYVGKNGLEIHMNSIDTILGTIDGPSSSAKININQGYKSLRAVMAGFYSQTYQSETSVRKMSRCGLNLTEAYIKAGGKTIPNQYVTGNAGNNFGDATVTPFITNIYKTMNAFSSYEKDGMLNITN